MRAALLNLFKMLKYRKAENSMTWVVVAIIIGIAIIAAVVIYTTQQPRPFWEITD